MSASAIPGNYRLIGAQMLRVLRGRRSQASFARRLGYRANPATDWENGRRSPTAQEVLRIYEVFGGDVRAAFASFHAAPLAGGRGAYELAAWLVTVRGSTSIKHVAERTGFSRFAVRRWFAGEAEPRLHEFLSLVDCITGRVYDLVAALVPIEQVPALRERYEAAQMMRNAAYVAPWSEAVLRVIETTRYRKQTKHRDGFIARRLGITVEEERRALEVLVKASVLRKEGSHYVVSEEDTVDTRGDRDRVTHLLQHWSAVAAARADQRGADDYQAYNVFSISAQDLQTAREIMRRAYRELRALAVATRPCERVALINVQLVALDAGERA